MGDIGHIERIIQVEPIPEQAPIALPVEEPAREPERVPA